jgi:hypothetical protein
MMNVVKIYGYLLLKGKKEQEKSEEIILKGEIPKRFDPKRIISVSKNGEEKTHTVVFSDGYTRTIRTKSAIKDFYKEYFPY